jgi:hypothetical protein
LPNRSLSVEHNTYLVEKFYLVFTFLSNYISASPYFALLPVHSLKIICAHLRNLRLKLRLKNVLCGFFLFLDIPSSVRIILKQCGGESYLAK